MQGKDSKGNYFSKNKWDGPFGLMVFDKSTGKALWSNTDLKKRATHFAVEGNNVWIADENDVYAFDLQSGKVNFDGSMKKTKTGTPFNLFKTKEDKIAVLCDDGMVGFDSAGKQAWIIKAKDVSVNSKWYGDNFIIITSSGIEATDLSAGKITGLYKFGKKDTYRVTDDGHSLFTINKGGVTKYEI